MLVRLVPKLLQKCARFVSTNSSRTFEMLNKRRLVRITGPDKYELLQGLVTNDTNHLLRSTETCIYALFLNVRGRVLFDTIIYRTQRGGDDQLLLEVDSEAVQMLCKHVKLYRLKKRVEIDEESCDLGVGVVYDTVGSQQDLCGIHGDVLVHKDPRLVASSCTCLRVLAPQKTGELSSKISELFGATPPENGRSYRRFRYALGVGEGTQELPPGECFPLETNGDFLHGISFHKGCYIGQELTARTYHTGVVRKRYMPLFFDSNVEKTVLNSDILHAGKRLGKLRGVDGDVGLALLRVEEAMGLQEFAVGSGTARTEKPSWWPEVGKDKVPASAGKSR